jgi:hypothetical protein
MGYGAIFIMDCANYGDPTVYGHYKGRHNLLQRGETEVTGIERRACYPDTLTTISKNIFY